MLASHIETILLVTGSATAGAFAVFVAPATTMKALFGETPADSLSLLIVRHWGLLIGLVGVLLIYAAYHVEIRVPILIVASFEKVVFAVGLFVSRFRPRLAAGVLSLADVSMAAMYLLYLASLKHL